MYQKNGKSVSLGEVQAAAKALSMSVEDWASEYGWSQGEGEPGKTDDSVAETAAVESVPMTAGGESISADTSLEQLELSSQEELSDLEKTKQDISRVKITAEDEMLINESIDYEAINARIASEKNIGIAEITSADRAATRDIVIAEKRRELLDSRIEDITKEYSDGSFLDWGMNAARAVARVASLVSTNPLAKTGLNREVIDATFRTDRQKEKEIGKASIVKEYGEKYEKAVESNNKGIAEVEKYSNLIKIADAELNELKTDIDRNGGDPEEYNALLATRNTMASKATDIWDEVSENTEGIGTIAEVKDMMGRSYSETDVTLNVIESSAANFIGGLAKLTKEITPVGVAARLGMEEYVPKWGESLNTTLDSVSDELFEEGEYLRRKSRKQQEFLKIESPADVIDFAIDLFSAQAINTAVTVGLPGAGLYLVSGSAAGSKMHEMSIDIDGGKKISPAQFYGAAAMHGLGEYITERVSLGQAKRALGLSKKAAKITKFMPNATNMRPSFMKAWGTWSKGVLSEGAAEMGAQWFGNAADKYILGEDISTTDGFQEAFWSGAFMSGIGFGAPVLAQDLYRASTTGVEMKANQDRVKEMMSIKARVDELSLDPNPDASTASAIAMLTKRTDELATENLNSMKVSEDRIDELSRGAKRRLLDTESEAYRVRAEVDKIDNNPKLTTKEKLNLAQDPVRRLDKLEKRKDQILGNSENSKAKANARSVQMQAAAELGIDFEYINAANSEDATTAAIDYVNNSNLDDKAKANLISELNQVKDTEGVNGFYIGADVGLPIALSTDDGARRNSSVAAHEVAHATIFKALLDGDADMIAIADNLERYMVANYKGAKARFDKVKQTYPEGKFSKEDIAEERLNAIVEYARQKNIKLDKTLQGKLMASWRKLRSPKLAEVTEIKTGKDVLDLIISFNSSFDKGELSGLAKKVASKNVKAAATTASENSNNTKLSKSKPTVLESINALVPDNVITKAEFQNRKVFNAVYAATEPGGAISNYVRSKSESKEVADKAMESVVDRLINYDPAAVRKKANGDPITFGEFIFANTNFGKLDARKSLAIEAKETARKVSIDSEQAKEIADKDTAADPSTTGKPKRMNLVTRGVVSTEAVSKAQETVKRAIGALKVPFNKQTSLNVTVKPYIAALKKGFAEKELVKAVAQDMGNGGDLKSWMRKHKTAILDNMTTTYLIGAFPAAIQKQVKGTDTWTSDWAGKEIQREKTTTANAGRTSGAFMVRRLPNASSKISDAAFVGMLFDDKGVIKPGKKPSLAKAIAEEIGFDILTTEIQNPDGQIAEAFKDNQEALGVVMLENTMATMRKDAERGSAKFSIAVVESFPALFYNSLEGGDQDVFDSYYNALSKADQEEWQRVSDPLINSIEATIRVREEFIKILPKELQEISKKLIESKTNKKSPAALKSMAEFNEALLNKLPAELTSELTVDTFGINYNYLNVKKDTGAKLKKLKDAKKPTGVTLTFDASAVQPIQAGTGLMLKIQKLNYKDFTEGGTISEAKAKENKEAALEEQFGQQIRDINAANPAALAMILEASLEVVMENPLLLEGFLRTLEGQSMMGQALRGLTGIAEVEVHGKSQGVYRNTETNDFYGKALTEKQRALKEKGLIVVNKDHPNYKAAIDFIQRNNKPEFDKSGTPTVVNLMNFKGEHLMPSAQVWLAVGKVAIQAVANAKKYPNAIGVVKAQATVAINNEILGFDQQLNSKVLSELQDKKMGSTNKSGYFRLLSLDKNQQNSFVSISEAGMRQTTQKLSEKIRGLMKSHEGYIAAWSNDQTINNKSAKFSIAQETDMSKAINDMIERNKGVQSEKVFSAVQAKKRGKTIGKYKFFSPAADDFRGLTSYTFAGKGKQGEADQKFFEDKLIKPYQRAINAIDVAKQTIKNDYAAIVKAFEPQAKIMRNKIPNSDYTYDQAIRVYMWTRQGTEVPGMSKRDLALLNKTISQDPDMIAFADAMLLVSKQGEWMAPSEHWLTNTVLSDLNNMSEKVGRKVYLEEFLAAKDIIFSPENLAKIEAAYGSKYVSALKDSLYRMENGTNRPSGDDATTNRWLNWINQSTGAIMFFNRRSAALQLLSTVNFINWSDNNPVKAAMAFANQKQFWTDFAMLFNSPKLKQRRAGLKTDVTQAEIANAVAGQTNKAAAALNYLLKKGFTFTQVADAFAIASGGASFYRNRVNTYLKQGMSQNEAETLAFEEFSSTADESQQSSDPMLISQQQAGVLGRLVLAFQNTTMQYTRLMKKSTQDLINRRGDPKTNISKIIYYGAVQNFVFSALQSALFSFIPGFADEDDEDKTREEKLDGATVRIINSMVDSILKGSGLTGAVISTLKNATMKYVEQEEKGYNADHIYTFLSVMSISPPMGSKLSKLYKAQQTKRFEKDALAARPFGVVADGRVNLGPGYRIVGNLAAAVGSVPLDRVVDEVTSISEALDSRNTEWQRLALAIGWKAWAVGAKNEEHDLLKEAGKKQRDKDGKAKAAATREANKKAERERIANMGTAERSKYEEQKVLDKINKKVKKLENR